MTHNQKRLFRKEYAEELLKIAKGDLDVSTTSGAVADSFAVV